MCLPPCGCHSCTSAGCRESRGSKPSQERSEGGCWIRSAAESQPNRNSVAAPQMRPWQGPMPQRVCSLASRHETCSRKAPYETSSQRQTMVDSVASFFRCGSSAVAFLSARTNPSAPSSTRNQLLRCCLFSRRPPVRLSGPQATPVPRRRYRLAPPRRTHPRPRFAADRR